MPTYKVQDKNKPDTVPLITGGSPAQPTFLFSLLLRRELGATSKPEALSVGDASSLTLKEALLYSFIACKLIVLGAIIAYHFYIVKHITKINIFKNCYKIAIYCWFSG
jgi:hypothetical protein